MTAVWPDGWIKVAQFPKNCQNVVTAAFILKVIFFLFAVFEINHIPFFNLMDLIFNFLMIRFVAKHFFSLHYLLPFVIAALALVRIIALHEYGSSNPIGISANIDKIPFHPYLTIKDLLGFVLVGIFISYLVYFAPNALGQRWPFFIILL